ncbi:hypothetical protein ACFQH2_17050 [Natronoarchaeum sp. GCM10025703]|uniref:hypothetical protein n=1 Tax=unclassified Natronoarchaeum TaxID=2620183 RepID=UPI0036134F78
MSSEPSDTMHERVSGSGVGFWILLRVQRWALVGAILVIVYVALVALSTIGFSPLRTVVASANANHWIFSAFIGAIITGTSIVVTINQLVLSQELGAVGDQRERMSEAMAFRQDVEAAIQDGTSPAEPSAFLYVLLDSIEERANGLKEQIEDERDETLEETIDEYADNVIRNAQSVKANLKGAEFGTFEVIWSALDFNYSWKISRARQLRSKHAESLSDEATEEMDEMIEVLKFFGPAREHFKTLYFQWELINLSRALLYIAIPALTVMGTMLMYVDASTLPGATLGIDNLVWLISAGFVVGIAPFVVFIAFVLRITTVAKRTLAIGTFILRETDREYEFDE